MFAAAARRAVAAGPLLRPPVGVASLSSSSLTCLQLETFPGSHHRITLNRPDRLNAINSDMVAELKWALQHCDDADDADDAPVIVLTGAGRFFTSGNDLAAFADLDETNVGQKSAELSRRLESFVGAFIDLQKPLLAAVNGPGVGFGCTVLGLCDAAVVSDRATFLTPFTQTAQSPEMCSSYLFPKILGPSLANSMLLFNHTLSAEEALRHGLVSEVVPHDDLESALARRLEAVAQLPAASLRATKKLIREAPGGGAGRKVLHAVNRAECKMLEERWNSPEFLRGVKMFRAAAQAKKAKEE